MSQYLVLSQIDIQNANSIAGLTWGFPAITQFLGFTHALSRKISNTYDGDYATELTGCAVVAHTFQNKVYQPQKYADFEFLQSKNPPVLAKHKSSSPPIIEEGKMNLTVSIVIELDNPLMLTTDGIQQFEQRVLALIFRMRLAGGIILNIRQAKLLTASTQKQQGDMLRKIKRLTLPGFALIDRNAYLQEHHQEILKKCDKVNNGQGKPQILDAWLDFSALKFKSNPQLSQNRSEPDEKTPASWEYVAKPYAGYLVPLMTGYKAISKTYDPGIVENTRDAITPTRFVEAIHSVGEWKGMHSIKVISDIIWRYEQEGQWYLCKQNGDSTANKIEADDEQTKEALQTQALNFNDALNLF
jgi:CRISPR-associated protein Csy2